MYLMPFKTYIQVNCFYYLHEVILERHLANW